MTQRLDMLTQHELQRRLPEGWETPTERKQQALQAEFLLERPQDHPLHGMELRVIAYREGNDDILLLHLDTPECVSVVHLTWSRRQEFPSFPKVEFTGTLQAFVEREYRLYGLTADEDAGYASIQGKQA